MGPLLKKIDGMEAVIKDSIWPAAPEQANAVTVRYVAGYAEVPEAINTWIKVMTAAMYENRSAETVGSGSAIQLVQLGYVDRLLDRFKVWGV